MNTIKIGNRIIGSCHPPVVIAEIGINHGGDLSVAMKMVDAAVEAGAEIIKHQTHIVEDEMSNEANFIKPQNSNSSIFQIMEKCALSEKDEYKLMKHVQESGRIFLSTPFSRAAVNRLVNFDVPAFKIGSGECNNYPLIKYIAKFGKPVILSTGMNGLSAIQKSVEILQNYSVPYALLHCTNIYPTPPEYVRLGGMTELKNSFSDAVIGLSDHTTSNYSCFGAVALGASILERHFTDSMTRSGPDIVCSMDPKSLRDLIKGSKEIYLASGGKKEPHTAESKTIAFAYASIVANRDINAGEILTSENIWVMRPGDGDFLAADYDKLLGSLAVEHISKGSQIKRNQILLFKHQEK
jgi:N-acetylneuraminate synthase